MRTSVHVEHLISRVVILPVVHVRFAKVIDHAQRYLHQSRSHLHRAVPGLAVCDDDRLASARSVETLRWSPAGQRNQSSSSAGGPSTRTAT